MASVAFNVLFRILAHSKRKLQVAIVKSDHEDIYGYSWIFVIARTNDFFVLVVTSLSLGPAILSFVAVSLNKTDLQTQLAYNNRSRIARLVKLVLEHVLKIWRIDNDKMARFSRMF